MPDKAPHIYCREISSHTMHAMRAAPRASFRLGSEAEDHQPRPRMEQTPCGHTDTEAKHGGKMRISSQQEREGITGSLGMPEPSRSGIQ